MIFPLPLLWLLSIIGLELHHEYGKQNEAKVTALEVPIFFDELQREKLVSVVIEVD